MTISFISVVYAWYHSRNTTQPMLYLWLGAILFRIIGICAQPIFEDDYYRYLWDGFQTATTGNPYLLPPSAFFDSDTGIFEPVLDAINNPEIKTIYGPICQLFFALGYWITPADVTALQILFSLLDLGLIALLLQLTHARNVLLYAWSPLSIKEISMSAHTEVIALFFLVLAIYLMLRQQRYKVGAMVLALAVGSKLFALLALPFLLFLRPNIYKTTIPVFIIALLITYNYLWIDTNFGLQQYWNNSGLQAMVTNWLFNAPVYFILLEFSLPFQYAKILIVGIGILIYGLYWLHWLNNFDENRNIRLDYIFAGMLLILPSLNPWYGLWLLVFACMHTTAKTIWTQIACYALFFAYLTALNLNLNLDNSVSLYHIPQWALLTEFGLIIAALAYSVYLNSIKR